MKKQPKHPTFTYENIQGLERGIILNVWEIADFSIVTNFEKKEGPRVKIGW